MWSIKYRSPSVTCKVYQKPFQYRDKHHQQNYLQWNEVVREIMRSVACLCFCLPAYSRSNFWQPWPRNFILVHMYVFKISRSRSSIKVIWTNSIHTRVVCFRVKSNLVSSAFEWRNIQGHLRSRTPNHKQVTTVYNTRKKHCYHGTQIKISCDLSKSNI